VMTFPPSCVASEAVPTLEDSPHVSICREGPLYHHNATASGLDPLPRTAVAAVEPPRSRRSDSEAAQVADVLEPQRASGLDPKDEALASVFLSLHEPESCGEPALITHHNSSPATLVAGLAQLQGVSLPRRSDSLPSILASDDSIEQLKATLVVLLESHRQRRAALEKGLAEGKPLSSPVRGHAAPPAAPAEPPGQPAIPVPNMNATASEFSSLRSRSFRADFVPVEPGQLLGPASAADYHTVGCSEPCCGCLHVRPCLPPNAHGLAVFARHQYVPLSWQVRPCNGFWLSARCSICRSGA
jgi:hypothetical protein